MASRPFITCHVLDTTAGRPAAGIKVTLSVDDPYVTSASLPTLHGTTNNDGRVTGWTDSSPEQLVEQVSKHAKGDRLRWKLVFETEPYFGPGKTFFPQVEIPFFTDLDVAKSHYHVPLLLGPWSYTTYRGS